MKIAKIRHFSPGKTADKSNCEEQRETASETRWLSTS